MREIAKERESSIVLIDEDGECSIGGVLGLSVAPKVALKKHSNPE